AVIILVLQPVVPFHVLTDDAGLIRSLLKPEVTSVTAAAHAPGIRHRRCPGHYHNGLSCPARRMDGAAVVLRPDIDMNCRSGRFAGRCSIAQSRVERGILMR